MLTPRNDRFFCVLPRVFCIVGILISFSRFSFSEEIRYESQGRRDPFESVNEAEATSSQPAAKDIVIEGIIYDSKGKSIALISGDAYRVGDVVADKKILEIKATSIVVALGDQLNEIHISPETLENNDR